jgi:hypothetical protein
VASPNINTNGVGGTTGAAIALLSPLYTSGDIWYVSSSTGSDAAAPRGKERIRPLATLAQACTNAAVGDIIVCLSGHAETLTSGQTFSEANQLIIGEGSGSTRPRFTRGADIVMFNVTAAGVQFNNIYFPATTVASTSSRVKFAGVRNELIGCYFECGTLDNGAALETVTGASQVGITGSNYFVSTSTSTASQPANAITVTNTITDLEIDTLVLDGGSSGWSDPYALKVSGAITRMRATNVDLLGDSDVTIVTGTTGHFHIRNKTGSPRVAWAA